MIKIAVCDDDPAFLAMAEAAIGEYSAKRQRRIEARCFADPARFRAAHEAEGFPVVWLGIAMPGQNGAELARTIFAQDGNCIIAFLSSSPDSAVEGYGVNAVRYLLKPATPETLDNLLDRCLERYAALHSGSLVLRTGGIARRLNASAILYLESHNKQVDIHCRDEVLTVPGKLSDLLQALPAHFVQTHKSYLVNLHCAVAMNRDEIALADGVRIPVSRQFHKETARRYLDYVASEGAPP